MKKLHMMTATAGLLIALAGPSLAASQTHASDYGNNVNSVRTYGDRDDNNPPSGRNLGYEAYARGNLERPYQYAPLQDLPYAGRPYGDPNGW